MHEEHEPSDAPIWRVRREATCLRYFVDLPGVLEPDLDVAIEGAFLMVRALRTLPENRLLSCRLPVPTPFSAETLRIRFEWGVLEIDLPARGGA